MEPLVYAAVQILTVIFEDFRVTGQEYGFVLFSFVFLTCLSLSNHISLVLAARLGKCQTGRVVVLHCVFLNHILVAGILVRQDEFGGGCIFSFAEA